jgi:hypothetical protein
MRYWVFIITCSIYGNLFGSYFTQENINIACALKDKKANILLDIGAETRYSLYHANCTE